MWPDYLKQLEARNPQLLQREAKVTITVESFLRQLERAYEAGRSENAGRQLFDQLFGGTRRKP